MRTLKETFDIIQREINNIKDPAARQKAQEKFDLMPKEEKSWELFCRLEKIPFEEYGVDATSSPEKIEQTMAIHLGKKQKKHFGITNCYTIGHRDPNTQKTTYYLCDKAKYDEYETAIKNGENANFFATLATGCEIVKADDVELGVYYKCNVVQNENDGISFSVNAEGIEGMESASMSVRETSDRADMSYSFASQTDPANKETTVNIFDRTHERLSLEQSKERDMQHGGKGWVDEHQILNKDITINTTIKNGEVVEINGLQETSSGRISRKSVKRLEDNQVVTSVETGGVQYTKGKLKEGDSLTIDFKGEAVSKEVFEGKQAVVNNEIFQPAEKTEVFEQTVEPAQEVEEGMVAMA